MKRSSKKSDEYWMGLALDEAVKARGHTSPNPMVGAVLVRKGKVLATGYHHRAGLPHAEIEALRRAKDVRGATLYVTLEPCCHEGKRTPPCVQAILRSGIRRVVVAGLDPNPKVSGRGLRMLRRAGIATKVGVLAEDCANLNLFYNHWIRKKTPWVLLKAAASLDGRVALADGTSRWITGSEARTWVHRLRHEVDGVLVGIGTVLADDPRLTARHRATKRQPIRVILDPNFRIPLRAKVLDPMNPSPCWVVVAPAQGSSPKRKKLERLGGKVIVAPMSRKGEFDLPKLLQLLGRQGLLSLLVEGGPGVWTNFVRHDCFQELLLFLAPKLLGADAKALLGTLGLKRLPANNPLRLASIEVLGSDVLLVYRRISIRPHPRRLLTKPRSSR